MLHEKQMELTGYGERKAYEHMRAVEILSGDAMLIAMVMKEISELMEKGVPFMNVDVTPLISEWMLDDEESAEGGLVRFHGMLFTREQLIAVRNWAQARIKGELLERYERSVGLRR